MKLPSRSLHLAAIAAICLVAGGSQAQLEGSDRGVAPIDSASTFEVTGIDVDTSGKTAEEAREEGWKEAQRRGWKALWAKTNGRPLNEAPELPDSSLNGMVSGIVVEQEQIGPHRYIATLGVLFDRARTGELLGVGGVVRRSARRRGEREELARERHEQPLDRVELGRQLEPADTDRSHRVQLVHDL